MRARGSFAVARDRRRHVAVCVRDDRDFLPAMGSCTNLEWDNLDSLKLLDLYEKHAVLWNPRHAYYYNKTKKQNAWEAVARACEVPIREVKRKMESLLSSFRRERCKCRKMNATANGDENRRKYVSRWFAYKKMSFLLDKEEPKEFLDYDDDVSLQCDADQAVGDSNPATEDGPLFTVEAVYETEAPAAATDPEASSGASSKPHARDTERSKILKAIIPSLKPSKGAKRSASDSEEDAKSELSDLLTSIAEKARRGDDCSTFGDHVANKLREYNKRTKAIVEHHISNILFQADMGEFEHTTKLSIQSTGFTVIGQTNNQGSALHGSVDSSSCVLPTSF